MKNILKVIGALLVLRVVFHLLRGGRSRATAAHWRRRMADYRSSFEGDADAPVPVDNQWSRPSSRRPQGAAHSVPVG
ncbi:hypothetical protein [Hymenobacter negativus]|uniref:DUF4834 family protein n=1 Tax=Hymenobacter negativus TaxID=2795026 RepID=A0ABS3Q982_9BACT|nr:hypothetical protein [Hymenobacter negativus]MBO2007798.1 hypothetical protein [Hymenobacter negativus]